MVSTSEPLAVVRDSALRDLRTGLLLWRVAAHLAWRDVVNSTRRTILGPIWLLLQKILWAVGLVLISSALFGRDESRTVYVAVGFLLFSTAVGLVGGAAAALTGTTGMRSAQLPVSSRFLVTFFRENVNLAVAYLPILMIAIAGAMDLELDPLPVLVSVLLLEIWGFGLALLLGPLCLRYRDLLPIIGTLLSLAMFFTPVFWSVSQLAHPEVLEPWVYWNPLAVFLDLMRNPFLGVDSSAELWLHGAVLALSTLTVGLIVFRGTWRKIGYWST